MIRSICTVTNWVCSIVSTAKLFKQGHQYHKICKALFFFLNSTTCTDTQIRLLNTMFDLKTDTTGHIGIMMIY